MTTLISFLGKGRDNQGYREANYHFADGQLYSKQKYIGLALMQKLKPQKMIFLGTSGSMWDVFLEAGMTELEDQWLHLSEAVQQQCVTEQQLQPFEQLLSQTFGIPVRCVLIPFARHTTEQIEILSVLSGLLEKNETVVMDVTHGFRHLPMLALVAARFLKTIQQVHVEQIYYGALDMTQANQTPVLQLDSLLGLLDWVDGLATFDKDGDYGVFSQLLAGQGLAQRDAERLKQAAFFERTNNSSNARQKLSTVFQHIEVLDSPIFNLFKQQLVSRLTWFKKQSRGLREQQLAQAYLQRHDYLRAVIYAMEGKISHSLYQDKQDENNFAVRKAQQDKISQTSEVFKKLTILRNALAHGLRPNDNQKQVLTLLDEETHLQQSLKEWFKQLCD